MLKFLAVAAIIVVSLVAIVCVYAANKPDAFQVTRSVSINAAPEKIFPLIDDLHNFNRWNPFLKQDPDIKLTYSGPASSEGAVHEWAGNRHVGKGRLEITESAPASKVAMKLDMIEPIEGHNNVEFILEPRDGTTTVRWSMSGESAYIAKVMGVFVSMDKMIGGAFENGLADLKAMAER